MDDDKNKKIILVLVILTVIFTIIGGSLAYFSWISSEAQKTNIVFTVERTFSCAADGGGSITNNSAIIVPTLVNSNTTGNYIKREVKVTPTINESGKTIYMDLWLDINKLDSGLSNSTHFNYAFTTSSTSNTTGVVASGNFNGKVGNTNANEMTSSNRVNLLSNKSYSATTTDTYYLWIWLDAEETSSDTMDQSFSLSLNGSCGDAQPASAPDLDDGMIPVVISNNGIATTVSKDNNNWYNYNNKEWANVVLVNSSSRSKYLNTSGVTVNEDDILAYYVWIPRYSYRIPIVSCSTISNPTYDDYPSCYIYVLSDNNKTSLINWFHEFISAEMNASYTLEQATTDVNNCLNNGSCLIQGLEDKGPIDFLNMISAYNEVNDPDITYTTEFNSSNNLLTGPREIDIVFEDKTTTKQNGDAIDTYHTHPAFTFGDTELNGIWVGKFETTGSADTPTIKPNVQSLRNQNISTQFATSQKLGTSMYGSTSKVDAHMMKNSEWGAVAYLSHSKYGVNREVYKNNSSQYYTGRSGGNIGGSTAINTVYTDQTSKTGFNTYGFYTWDGYLLEYNTNNKTTVHDISKVASTTGNITGVYDMSGGAYEYVMGVFANSDGTLWSGGSTNNSGFTGLVGSNGTSYTGVNFPNSKYYDVYKAANGTSINPLTACDGGICYGHALSETSHWYNDYEFFAGAYTSWFKRGDYYYDSVSAGAFNFSCDYGHADRDNGFRSVVSFVGA